MKTETVGSGIDGEDPQIDLIEMNVTRIINTEDDRFLPIITIGTYLGSVHLTIAIIIAMAVEIAHDLEREGRRRRLLRAME